MREYRLAALRRRATAEMVAKSLGVAPQTVRNWIAKGWLRARWAGGSVAYVRTAAVKRALMLYPQVANTVMRAKARTKRG